MTTFVLVHGAWAGAHGFRKIRGPLHAAGHAVFTPSLTGLGERVHLTSPHVGLSVHVSDVVNHVLYEDLSDVVLLGFSYGGMVVTGALQHIADRVRHLVYLDAFVPQDGQSVNDLRGAAEPAPLAIGTPWLLPPLSRSYPDPADGAWSDARRVDQPVRTFSEPVRLPQPLHEYPFTRTYVKATADPTEAAGSAFWAAAAHAQTSSAWRYREVACDHLIPVNKPDELVALLLELA
jgi:pimeloyl-ACP methyl ester carboxylesterase